MSTQIKRIEKEYFLSKVEGDQIPVVYLFNRQVYLLKIDKITKENLLFISDRLVDGLVVNKRVNLIFDYKGLIISFNVEVKDITNDTIKTTIPDVLYKNLGRANLRVGVPDGLEVELVSLEDRYSLPFPKSTSFEALDVSAVLPGIDPSDFNAVSANIAAELKNYADGNKLVYYNTNVKPEKDEECVVSESGKILLVPSTSKRMPDFPADKKFVTKDIFRRYFETIGVGETFLDQSIEVCLNARRADGVDAVMWVPFLFQEYVVGYINIWKKIVKGEDPNPKPPYDEALAEKVYWYGKCLVYALEKRGYFEAGRMKDRVINGRVVDISASGLRFAVPNTFIYAAFQPNLELGAKIHVAGRTINSKIHIRRRYKEGNLVFLGCSFIDMQLEDVQFLFGYIYGNQTAVANLISGSV